MGMAGPADEFLVLRDGAEVADASALAAWLAELSAAAELTAGGSDATLFDTKVSKHI